MICRIARDAAFNQDVKALIPKAGIDARFIFYSLSSITLMVFVKFRTVGLIMAMTSFLAIGLVWRIVPEHFPATR